jgi:hypothetical protein
MIDGHAVSVFLPAGSCYMFAHLRVRLRVSDHSIRRGGSRRGGRGRAGLVPGRLLRPPRSFGAFPKQFTGGWFRLTRQRGE